MRRDSEKTRDAGDTLSPVLTMREATRLLNVHGNTLRRWADDGVIKAYRLGPRGERRFKREDIDALFSDHAEHRQAHAGKTA
jgi:excisionase family DNA binding protein